MYKLYFLMSMGKIWLTIAVIIICFGGGVNAANQLQQEQHRHRNNHPQSLSLHFRALKPFRLQQRKEQDQEDNTDDAISPSLYYSNSDYHSNTLNDDDEVSLDENQSSQHQPSPVGTLVMNRPNDRFSAFILLTISICLVVMLTVCIIVSRNAQDINTHTVHDENSNIMTPATKEAGSSWKYCWICATKRTRQVRDMPETKDTNTKNTSKHKQNDIERGQSTVQKCKEKSRIDDIRYFSSIKGLANDSDHMSDTDISEDME